MRTFLVNFIYISASQYNADFGTFKQATFPTSHEINKHIQAIAFTKGLLIYGPILWTGISKLSGVDEEQFNHEEE